MARKRKRAATAKKKTGRVKARAAKAARSRKTTRRKARQPAKMTPFQVIIDTINQTERLRNKLEPRGADETE